MSAHYFFFNNINVEVEQKNDLSFEAYLTSNDLDNPAPEGSLVGLLNKCAIAYTNPYSGYDTESAKLTVTEARRFILSLIDLEMGLEPSHVA